MAFCTGSLFIMSSSIMAVLGSSTSGEDAPNAPYLAALAGPAAVKVERIVATVAVWMNWRRDMGDFVLMESAMDLLILGEAFGENAVAEPSMAAVDRTPEIFMLLVFFER